MALAYRRNRATVITASLAFFTIVSISLVYVWNLSESNDALSRSLLELTLLNEKNDTVNHELRVAVQREHAQRRELENRVYAGNMLRASAAANDGHFDEARSELENIPQRLRDQQWSLIQNISSAALPVTSPSNAVFQSVYRFQFPVTRIDFGRAFGLSMDLNLRDWFPDPRNAVLLVNDLRSETRVAIRKELKDLALLEVSRDGRYAYVVYSESDPLTGQLGRAHNPRELVFDITNESIVIDRSTTKVEGSAEVDNKPQTPVAKFTVDGTYIVTGSSHGFVEKREIDSLQRVWRTSISTGPISEISVSNSGKLIYVTPSDENVVFTLSSETGEVYSTHESEHTFQSNIAISNDDDVAATIVRTSDTESELILWSTENWNVIDYVRCENVGPSTLQFGRSDEVLAVGSKKGLEIYFANPLVPIRKYLVGPVGPRFQMEPNGIRLSSYEIALDNALHSPELLEHIKGPVVDIDANRNGTTVMTVSEQAISLWNMQSKSRIASLQISSIAHIDSSGLKIVDAKFANDEGSVCILTSNWGRGYRVSNWNSTLTEELSSFKLGDEIVGPSVGKPFLSHTAKFVFGRRFLPSAGFERRSIPDVSTWDTSTGVQASFKSGVSEYVYVKVDSRKRYALVRDRSERSLAIWDTLAMEPISPFPVERAENLLFEVSQGGKLFVAGNGLYSTQDSSILRKLDVLDTDTPVEALFSDDDTRLYITAGQRRPNEVLETYRRLLVIDLSTGLRLLDLDSRTIFGLDRSFRLIRTGPHIYIVRFEAENVVLYKVREGY